MLDRNGMTSKDRLLAVRAPAPVVRMADDDVAEILQAIGLETTRKATK